MKIEELLLKEARKAYKANEVPIGCVIVHHGKMIAKAHNNKQKKHLCTNHAEILAIQKAEKRLKDWRLEDCDLYVTLEPCKMCKEVIKQSRIKNVYYLLPSTFDNEEAKKISYQLIENSVDKTLAYKDLLQSFFAKKR